MNKTIKRVVFIPMAFLTLLSLFGCGESRDEKASKRILESLQQKYGEEFVLDGIGGSWGTMNNNTLKAIVRPKDDVTLKVPVEITKDFSKMYDKYLNQRVARNEEPKIEELVRTYWPDAKVVIANDTRQTYPEENDTSMSYTEFQKRYPMNTQLVSIYLNGDDYIDARGNMDQKGEVDKYMEFAKVLAEHQYVSSMVTWTFLTKDAYDRLDEAKASDDSVDKYFTDEEEESGKVNIITMIGYSLDAEGQVEESRDEIESYFDTWKEKRLKSLELRGGS
ncbi:hypothetical protein G5B47_10435 [Paenibacillus sp. 7124]|uniref:Uncharacterized protein n=1 Tax=Paenibacillus apii TaxID=1850370 RepID=A0A6M1PI02_9BACL|nr:hypothetical protein [Paenibacillus apii]NGM82830.1 hypothetical protein [Paenibacillus apii]NJJ39970.1 hypothetical protein [Paenibacillus apii]